MAAAGGELLALHRHELRRHDLGRQVEPAEPPRLAALVALAVVAEQLGRPDDRVEDDVVLAHEVVGQRLGVVPPLPPALGVARIRAGPLDGGRQVADHRVEPDVEPLGGLLGPALDRHRDAPVDVAGHRPRLEVLDEVERELDDVGPPGAGRLAALEVLLERLGQRRQVEEEVLGLDELRRLAVDLRPRVDQVGRVELVAAVVALVAARVGVPADRAGALDVAVRAGCGRSTARSRRTSSARPCSRWRARPRRAPGRRCSGCPSWCA